jgi:translation elongation factor EF-G
MENMKKEDIIKLGVTDEAIAEKIADAWTDKIKGFRPDYRFNEVKDERDQAREQIKALEGQLDTLKQSAGVSEDLKKQIEKLQTDNDKTKADYEAKLNQTIIDSEVDRALLRAGAKNTKAVKALLDLAKVQRDGETIKGHEDQIKALLEAEDSKFLFNTQSNSEFTFRGTKPGERGEGGSGSGTKNPWSKDHYNLTEQGRILRDDPELAKQLKNA